MCISNVHPKAINYSFIALNNTNHAIYLFINKPQEIFTYKLLKLLIKLYLI